MRALLPSEIVSYFRPKACVLLSTDSLASEEIASMNRKHFVSVILLFLMSALVSLAETPDTAPAQDQSQAPPAGGNRGPGHGGGTMPGRGGGIIGKITSINGDSLVLTRPDGSNVTVKLTDKTEFRKDRQPAKIADFKIGDFVMVRGEENPDHSVTAQLLGGRSANAGDAGGGPRGGQFFAGEMGKDFLAGQVKAIDAPKLMIERVDNVTQTVELTEDTTLRKGRDSITMADLQPGDHVVVHGNLENKVFVPRAVVVLSPEQWERIEQFAQSAGGSGGNSAAPAPSNPAPHQ